MFQNEHPEIRLIPINMSNGVARMYAHVTGTAGRLDRDLLREKNMLHQNDNTTPMPAAEYDENINGTIPYERG